jgi:hypothetical protein
MDIKNVFVIIIILLLLYVVIRFLFKSNNTLTQLSDGTKMQTVAAQELAVGAIPNSTNFTYSIWFYIEDWNYKYGDSKVLFGRMSETSSKQTKGASTFGNDPCPLVVLGETENNLDISLTCYPGTPSSNLGNLGNLNNSKGSGDNIIHNCKVTNIPIQKWVNLLISTYGRTLDVYLDGKLVKTCVLPGIVKINNAANVYVTPLGGFYGWTSKFQYFPNSTDPQTAWNIYKAGYGDSWLSNLFGKYAVKISFMSNGKEKSKIQLG